MKKFYYFGVSTILDFYEIKIIGQRKMVHFNGVFYYNRFYYYEGRLYSPHVVILRYVILGWMSILQSMMDAKIGQQIYLDCYENMLVKMIPYPPPPNLYLSFKLGSAFCQLGQYNRVSLFYR